MIAPAICHFSTVHTGIEIRIVRKQLATLAKAGYRTFMVMPATRADVEEARAMGITAIPLCEPNDMSRLSRMTSMAARALRLARRTHADLYHFHDPELIPQGLLLKSLGKHVVMDVHEDLKNQILVRHWIKPVVRKTVARIARGAELFGAGRFDAVVGAWPFLGTVFEKSAKRFAVVRNLPLLNELTVGTEAIEWSTRHCAAYAGNISRIRGINEIVQAVGIADVPLKLAGRFSSEEEHAAARALPGWNKVEELGFVDRQGVRAVMNASFAGMCTNHPIPNHVHGEPIKLFEYMAAGIPVITSRSVPNCRKVVEESDCGLVVDPLDPRDIAQAILFLRDHPERAQQMGRNGRQAVLERYNWDHEGRKLVALYRDILGA